MQINQEFELTVGVSLRKYVLLDTKVGDLNPKLIELKTVLGMEEKQPKTVSTTASSSQQIAEEPSKTGLKK